MDGCGPGSDGTPLIPPGHSSFPLSLSQHIPLQHLCLHGCATCVPVQGIVLQRALMWCSAVTFLKFLTIFYKEPHIFILPLTLQIAQLISPLTLLENFLWPSQPTQSMWHWGKCKVVSAPQNIQWDGLYVSQCSPEGSNPRCPFPLW